MSRCTWWLPVSAVALLVVLFLSTPALAVDPACQTMFDAQMKLVTAMPHHSYTTQTMPGGKSKTSEAIHFNGTIYINYNGKWIRSKMSSEDLVKQEQENMRNSKTTCRHVRDELVGGESAALYMAHSENGDVKSDAQTWISKSEGVPLRVEEDLDTGGGDKEHLSIRYEYNNVRPPAGVQ